MNFEGLLFYEWQQAVAISRGHNRRTMSLPGKSKRIVVEPIEVPTLPSVPVTSPDEGPERTPVVVPEPEKVPA